MHDELEKQIGTYLIGNIDDDGYLQCQTEEVAKGFGVEEKQICAVLEVVQSFDPPGVGAHDLQESLLIQLHHLEMDDSLAWKIVQHYLSQLDERYFQKIAKSFGATINEVITAVGLIRTLDPKPGSRFNSPRVEYIVPDVVVVKVDDDYQVILNEDGMPSLRINALYQNVLRQNDGMQSDTRKYLKRSSVQLYG